MKNGIAVVCLCAVVVLVGAHPLDNNHERTARQANSNEVTSANPLSREKRTIGILRDLFPNFSRDENDVAESKKNEVRIKRETPAAPAVAPAADAAGANASEEGESVEEEDLDSEATGDNEVAGASDAEGSEAEEEEEEEEEPNPEDPRNKRFLNFNLGATASENGGGGSAGGSGNFLFDIIRLVAGSGSGSSGSGDAAGGAAPEEGKHNDEAAYGVGVPGPLTRLFVVANRGVASLIQDLILRLAQTSERIVNFKARLITSII